MNGLKRACLILLTISILLVNADPALAFNQIQEERLKVQFSNKTTDVLTLKISGPESMTISLAANKATRANLLPGTYKYSYVACNRTFSGKFNVLENARGKVQTLINIQKCVGSTTNAGGANIEFLIENKTGAALYFTFTGPSTYRITVPAGKIKVKMVSGKYDFVVTGGGCSGGIEDSGRVNIRTGYYWRWFCK
jgi:hypothetical protein